MVITQEELDEAYEMLHEVNMYIKPNIHKQNDDSLVGWQKASDKHCKALDAYREGQKKTVSFVLLLTLIRLFYLLFCKQVRGLK